MLCAFQLIAELFRFVTLAEKYYFKEYYVIYHVMTDLIFTFFFHCYYYCVLNFGMLLSLVCEVHSSQQNTLQFGSTLMAPC